MHQRCLSLLLIASAASLSAEEPANIYIPGGENLDAAGKALLAQGDTYLHQAFHAVRDNQDPAEAERLLQKVISIQATVQALVGADSPGTIKAGIYGRAKKNRNIVERSGGLDGFEEMEMRSLTTVIDFDFKIHKRQVLANFASQSKSIKTMQKFIVDELYDHGNVHSRAGAQGDPAKPDAPKPPKHEGDDQQDNGPRRLATGPARQDQPQTAQQQQAGGGQFQDALLQSKQAPPQALPDGKPVGKNPDGTPSTAAKPADHPDAAAAQLPTTSGLNNPPAQPGQPLNASASSASASNAAQAPPTTEELAIKQEQVAKMLDGMATASRTQGSDAHITDAFRHAADAARNAAAAIRNGDHLAAANAARAAQHASDLALATAQGQGAQERQEQTAELESAVSGIQDRQSGIVTDAKKLSAALAAGTLSRDEGQQQGSLLAQRQAEVKEQIDALSHGIDALNEASTPSEGDTTPQAVHEGLRSAADALHEGRAPQEAVNATINLQQGHHAAALSAIARESSALEQAHAHLAAAADAAAGGHGSDRQALGELQRLSTALRRLSATTEAAVAGAKVDQDAATPATKGDNPGAGGKVQLPEQVGQVLDASFATLSKQLNEAMKDLPQATEAQRARIEALTKQRVAMGKDPGSNIEHLAALVTEVEGLEADLSRRIEQDHSHAALETFLQDPVPAAYRSSVADYYQLLADDVSATAASAAPAATPAAPGAGTVAP